MLSVARNITQAEILHAPTLRLRLEQLTEHNEAYLRKHPATPLLYQAGVHYRAAPPGEECWLPIPWALRSFFAGGTLDCKSLAAWRAAELRVRGNPARCVWTVSKAPGGVLLYHILVRRGDGSIEDPSALLGMGRNKEVGLWNRSPCRS